MTTKVNPLAVMDRAFEELDGYDTFYPLQYEMQEARAAVAELLEAAIGASFELVGNGGKRANRLRSAIAAFSEGA